MRSRSSSPATTALLFAAVAVIGLIGVFGVPQFAPVVASPSEESPSDGFEGILPPAEIRHSGGDGVGAVQGVDDLFAPLPEVPASMRIAPVSDRRLNREASVFSRFSKSSANATSQCGEFTRADSASIARLDAVSGQPGATSLTSDDSNTRPEAGGSAGMRRDADANRREGAAAETLTWRAAVGRLNELGIHKFQLTAGEQPNVFFFCCWYTPQENPRVTYQFEAEADAPLKTVKKVLEQIDAWRAARRSRG